MYGRFDDKACYSFASQLISHFERFTLILLRFLKRMPFSMTTLTKSE